MLSPEYTRIAEGAASAIAAKLSSATTMICAVTRCPQRWLKADADAIRVAFYAVAALA
jgi:hypothetical protein